MNTDPSLARALKLAPCPSCVTSGPHRGAVWIARLLAKGSSTHILKKLLLSCMGIFNFSPKHTRI